MIAAGVVGYFLRKWKFPVAPFIIGVVLGPTTENSVRQTLMMFKGDLTLIFNRPLAAALIGVALAFLTYRFLGPLFGKKVDIKLEEEDKL